jgi:sugar phosphate isomerase/epimerase
MDAHKKASIFIFKPLIFPTFVKFYFNVLMKNLNRQSFIRNTSLAMAGIAFAGPAFAKKKYTPKLSFSTLGCPAWSFQQILDNAVAFGYQGIEIRGIQKDMDITKGADFGNDAAIANSMKMLKDKNLKLVCLGASSNLHYNDPAKRKASLDEAKSLIDLANKVNCPYIRVFPDKLPKDQDQKATLNLIISGLKELGDYAKGSNVSVLMETHGDVVKAADVEYVMKNSSGSHVGLVWDVGNMWTVTQEPVKMVYEKLKKYIHHVHFRDAKLIDGKEESVLLGEGQVPLKEAASLLEKDNYKGFISFEWEKRWMPKVTDPEIAFPQFSKEIRSYF